MKMARQNASTIPTWLVQGYGLTLFLVFDLIVLGAAVRAFDAGLACPDWPLCFGDVIPDYHPQVYFEFIHRALAGGISCLYLVLTLSLWRHSSCPKSTSRLAVVGLAILSLQVIFGALTVWELLHEGVVTGHLILGLTFLAIVYWIRGDLQTLSQKSQGLALEPGLVAQNQRDGTFRFGRRSPLLGIWILAVGGLLLTQIILGGLVASYYASNVCTGFPLCNGQWVPTWRGPLGLQVLHRFVAYGLLLAVTLQHLVFRSVTPRPSPQMRSYSKRFLILVILQVIVGVGNVLLATPALMTVLHSGLAASLILTLAGGLRAWLVAAETPIGAFQSPGEVLEASRHP